MICCNHIVIVLLLCSNFIDIIKADNTNSMTETAQQRNAKGTHWFQSTISVQFTKCIK